MLGLILIYFVGKAFYELANKYDQSKWLFAILGVVSYYAGFLFSVFAIGVIAAIYDPLFLDSANELLLGLMALPFGVLTCYLFYFLLKRSWSRRPSRGEKVGEMVNEFGRQEEQRNFE